MTDKHFKSVLEELAGFGVDNNKHQLIESRASHILSSAINLMKTISENFPENEADELKKRFFLSIKNENPEKFMRGIKKLKESKK